jgi:glycosyltransferase involved in cell wall biosynthesis
MMLISVVIPTFNRSRLLRRTLSAFMGQVTEPWFDYEVLLVSNGSSDETGQVLSAAEKEWPYRLRHFRINPTGGPSAPRNYGIRLARGEVVIILDDDVLPDPTLVQEHARFHRRFPEEHHAGLGEVYVAPELESDPMALFHSFPYAEVRGKEYLSYLHFWTCNVSIKRQFMLRAGMFDERFLFYEDIICGRGLQANGMHLHFVPQARGQHLHEMKPGDVAAKGRFYGHWLYELFRAFPEPEIMRRFEIVSSRCGPVLLLKSALRRLRFRMIDNPLTWFCFRAAGAANGQRSRLSDFYYNYELRRNIFAGYSARMASRPPLLSKQETANTKASCPEG